MKEENSSNERQTELYRTTVNDRDGKKLTFVVSVDNCQFIVSEEQVSKKSRTAYPIRSRFYPSAVQAVMAMCDRIAREECIDLTTYADRLVYWQNDIIDKLRSKGITDTIITTIQIENIVRKIVKEEMGKR